MAAPSLTYTLTNGQTADADEVMQNFNDILNGITDGTKDITVSAHTVNGVATFNGTVTLGNATADTITMTGYVGSDIIPSANATYDLGSSSLNFVAIYLDNDATDGGAVYFDADGTTFIKCNAAGTDLAISGVSTVTVTADILPGTDATYDLGSTSANYVAAYLDNGATDGGAIYFNAGTTAYLKSDSSGGDLDVGGFTGLDLGTAEIKRMSLYDVAESFGGGNLTITDTDGISVVYATTGASDRTITLPTASDNAGRVITVKKVDSGAGILTLAEEGTDQIDGFSSLTIPLQNDFVTVQCTGSTWYSIARRDTTKWTSFTPSWANLSTSTNQGWWRRVGDSMEIMADAVSSSTVGGTISLTIPLSLTINTSVSSTESTFGYAYAADVSGGVTRYGGKIGYLSTTTVLINGGDALTGNWGAAVPFTWASGDIISLKLTVPIAEWDDTV